jgi:atrial natriuretic peptide-converting enzyme
MEDDEMSLLSFRANFRVVSGDTFEPSLVDTNSTAYRKKSRSYKELLNLLIRRSEHRTGFVGSEVLALDGVDERGMSVHFRLHYDRERTNVTSDQLRTLFHRLVNKTQPVRSEHFNKLSIDPNSIYIEGKDPNDSNELQSKLL